MTVIHGFELLREEDIPELNTKARVFRHVRTGAELISMENNDENKAFGIAFTTPPEDSTGLPHILEHSVLCGSRKYPVKEPFVELVKGSLNTFLNAMTYPDKTVYPFASQNAQDFYNLLDVYLDAVFYPRISPEVLQQEGWHYELDNLDDPLTYKGVVFNEMKGAYSSPNNVLYDRIQQTLFPENIYSHDSGGDPEVIPNLTYEDFRDFHRRYYHPSNARIWFYGDDDPNERLRRIDDFIREFERAEVNGEVALQAPFDAPRRVEYAYAAGEEDTGRKGMVTVSWVLPENTDVQLAMELSILGYILVGTQASPLRRALIDSGLGEDITGGGHDDSLRQMTFSTGLKGVDVADADKIEALILDTLAKLVREGIEADMIEAALNTVEFRLREQNTGQFPRGLALMIGALSPWLHGGDPLAALRFEGPLTAIKSQLGENSRLFEALIQKHLLDNPHRATVILRPDSELQARQEAAEREKLAQIRAGMTEEQLRGIIAKTQELRIMQETPDPPEALATLPMLTLDDLDKQNKIIPIAVSQREGAQLLYHDIFTNGIVYLHMGFNLHALPQAYLPYITLFGRALVGLGTEKEDFIKLSQRIGRKTGGVQPGTLISAVQGQSASTAWLYLSGKSTLEQTDDLLAILRDVLLTANLDNRERFKQIVLEEKARRESGLIPGGHGVVNSRLRAKFNEAAWLGEQIGGLSYLFFLRDLAEQIDRDWPAVLQKLEAIRSYLVNRNAALVNVTLDADHWAQFEPKLADFLRTLPAKAVPLADWNPEADAPNEGLTIPAKVNYVAKGANLYDLGYRMDGSINVINKFLGTSYLWEKIRVQGGAYGGFASFDQHSGVYTFLSYRDPNLLGTLDNYDGTARFLRALELSKEEVTRSIIGAIGDMDAYQLPDAKGYTSMVHYLIGYTPERRQRIRDQVLSTTAADFKAFGETLQALNEAGQVVVLGSKEAIEAANAARGGWLDVKKVL